MTTYIVVFVLYFAFIVITSIRSSKKVEKMADFTTGGHKMGMLLGVGTSVATWLSVASVMGVPGNLYSRGLSAVIGWVAGWFLANALFPLISFKIRMPETPTRTFPEFIRLRYEPKQGVSPLQLIVAGIMLIGYFIFSYIQVQGFGIVFSTVTGIKYEYAVFFFLLVLIFTSMGGFMSVAATDTLNACLILVGVVVAAITVLTKAGGWGEIMHTINTTTAPTFVGDDPIPAGILGSSLGTFSLSALTSIFLSNSFGASVAPHWIARYMAPKNAKAGAIQFGLTMWGVFLVFIPLIIIGLGAKTLIPSLPAGQTTDYLFPMVIMEYCHPIIGALALTGIAAAAVSTANSMLLHCSTSVIYDIKRQLSKKRIQTAEDDAKTTKQLRIAIFSLGVLAVICAVRPITLLAMGFTYVYGGFGTAFFWPVILGITWKRMNRAGAYAGIIFGMGSYIIATALKSPLPAFLVGAAISLVATLIAVFITAKPPVEAYESFFSYEVSESTKSTIRAIQREADETAPKKRAAAPVAVGAVPTDAEGG